jgi:transcriptional regulator with GAF, ATPase, and Fis domain
MQQDDALWEALPALLRAARTASAIRGAGVVRADGPGDAIVTYADALGAGSSRVKVEDLPGGVRPGYTGSWRLKSGDASWREDGFIEARVFQAGYPADVRAAGEARQLIAGPLPSSSGAATLLVAIGHGEAVTAADTAAIDALAAQVASVLTSPEPPASELERLRRLARIDELLPALFHSLDVAGIFEQLSTLTREVLPHDALGLGLFTEDRRQVQVIAQASPSRIPPVVAHGYPPVIIEHWLCNLVPDLLEHPVERHEVLAASGIRGSIRCAVRLDGNVLGGLSFNSREPDCYTAIDLSVGRRIADFVALALSHQRLAEQARQSEALRSRAATIELLRELLQRATGEGDLPHVWSRVSEVAQKVLPHDGLFLTAVLPNKTQARVYASIAPAHARLPDIVDVPAGIIHNDEWQYQIFDDLLEDDVQRRGQAAAAGYRAALRVPIRLDGEYVAGVSFLSLTPSRYTLADVAVARSVADGLTAQFIRERGRAMARQADEAAARLAALEQRVKNLTEELNSRAGYHRVIGESASWKTVLKQAAQVAATEATVLLLGESGTGKEVVARFIHRGSPRGKGPFVALNCAALPEQLLESELFGYERGAFTGAVQQRAGQLEQAAGGTLFLDEVAEMAPNVQAKFLRVLQEREFQRLGGTRVLKADTRVVAATNRDLERAIERQQFREDLYYRLNVFAIRLPPLRERRDDILVLSEALLEDVGRSLSRPAAGIAQDARRALLDYHWPGNVRELRNILERAAILADGGLIVAEHFAFRGAAPVPVAAAEAPGPAAGDGQSSDLKTVERSLIERAMADSRFNKSKAARQLGLTRAQLYAKLRRYGLE